jgi:hypothetical protein
MLGHETEEEREVEYMVYEIWPTIKGPILLSIAHSRWGAAPLYAAPPPGPT